MYIDLFGLMLFEFKHVTFIENTNKSYYVCFNESYNNIECKLVGPDERKLLLYVLEQAIENSPKVLKLERFFDLEIASTEKQTQLFKLRKKEDIIIDEL